MQSRARCILPKRKSLYLPLLLIFIAGCKPLARTGSEKFIGIKEAKRLVDYLSPLIRNRKYPEAVKLIDNHIDKGNFSEIGHALKVQVQTGHREEVRYFFEVFVARDVAAVNATIEEISRQHSTDKVLKLIDNLETQLQQVRHTYDKRQAVINTFTASIKGNANMHTYAESSIETLESLGQWLGKLEPRVEKALKSYSDKERAFFGGGTFNSLDDGNGPLEEYILQSVWNKWLTLKEKLAEVKHLPSSVNKHEIKSVDPIATPAD